MLPDGLITRLHFGTHLIRVPADSATLNEESGAIAICIHTCRATGITAHLKNGGTLENAADRASSANFVFSNAANS